MYRNLLLTCAQKGGVQTRHRQCKLELQTSHNHDMHNLATRGCGLFGYLTSTAGRSFVSDDELLAAARMSLCDERRAFEANHVARHVLRPHFEVQRGGRALQPVLVPRRASPCLVLCRDLRDGKQINRAQLAAQALEL